MARNVAIGVAVAYRGRRSMQAMRQGANMGAQGMAKLGSASANAAKGFNSSLDRMSRRLTRFAQITSFIFAGALVRDFIKTGAGFQKAFSGVQAVSQGTAIEFKKLRQQALDLGATTVFTAKQSAEAMEKLALSGLSVDKIFGIMPTVLNVAAAGQLDMAEAATIATGTLYGFGIEVEDFKYRMDQMVYTATRSNQTIRDLGASFSFVGPVAGAVGTTFEDVNASLAVLANRNLRAERSGTALRRIYSILIGDLEEGEKGIEGLGIEVFNTEGKFIGLADIIDQVNAKLGDGKVAINRIMDSFKQRAGPAFLALKSAGGDVIRAFEEELRNVGDTAKEVADKRLNNLTGRVTLMTSAFRNLTTEIFDRVEPSMSKLVTSATEFFKGFSSHRIDQITSSLSRVVKLLGEMALVLFGFRIASFFSGMIAGATGFGWALLTPRKGLDKIAWLLPRIVKRLGVLGVIGVAAVGSLAYQITRAAMEFFGLDDAVEDFFTGLMQYMKFDDVIVQIDSVIGRFNLLMAVQEQVKKPFGLKIAEDFNFEKFDSLLEEFTRHAEGGAKNMALVFAREIFKMVDDFDRVVDGVFNVKNELTRLALKFPELAAKAKESTTTMAEEYDVLRASIKQLTKDFEEQAAAMELQAKKVKELTEDAISFIDSSLEGVGFIRQEKLDEELIRWGAFMDTIGKDINLMKAFAEGASEEILNFGSQLATSGVNLSELDPEIGKFITLMLTLAGQVERTKVSTELATDAWDALGSSLFSVGMVSSTQLDLFVDKIELMEAAAAQQGVSTANYIAAIAEEVVAMIDAATLAGETIPQELLAIEEAARHALSIQVYREEFGEHVRSMAQEIEQFHRGWADNFKRLRDQSIASLGDMVGGFVTGQVRLSEAIKRTFKTLVAEGISMLIQWAIQRAIFTAFTVKAIASEHAAQLAGSMALVYTNTFASIAAIPIIGPALAPGAASAAVALAAAEATAAAAIGAALGAGMTAASGSGALAAGGIALRETRRTIGEAGPEAVVPLRGIHARRAAKEMGIGGGTVYAPTFNFLGDNWRDSGIDGELAETFKEAIDDMIANGTTLPFAVGRT